MVRHHRLETRGWLRLRRGHHGPRTDKDQGHCRRRVSVAEHRSSTPEYHEIGKKHFGWQAEQLTVLRTVDLAPQPLIVNNRMKDVPAEGLWGSVPGPTSPSSTTRSSGSFRTHDRDLVSCGRKVCASLAARKGRTIGLPVSTLRPGVREGRNA